MDEDRGELVRNLGACANFLPSPGALWARQGVVPDLSPSRDRKGVVADFEMIGQPINSPPAAPRCR